ncbi:hypothetical protein A2W14_02220 [Candidatus Gottesmanbacteria bacterium RBG_16_37_8]|uniref:Uncharacterized protein n=1 Tax=Candidatus Gottesmanbacteria bacterium RBG_16_37_8 TaxID=1798371 RepID=A0A1F5YRM7_9BACT|nr:MAG: hypothetical protein A2W14_02220 [Candidatus Gottesmanbacteria bacterium RBG_16_37_8]
MKLINKYALFFFFIFLLVILILSSAFYITRHDRQKAEIISQAVENIRGVAASILVSPTPSIPAPTPTIFEYTIGIVNLPADVIERGFATFTWNINGPPTTIKSTSVYFGQQSTPGNLTKDILPQNTKYSQSLKEFQSGNFAVPLVFVGNQTLTKAATYFARAYAQINGNNYWSDEKSFTVKEIPKNEIRIVNYPGHVKLNDNSTFTWEITGPATTIGYTVIVGSKESKSGMLDETVGLEKTPYKVLVKDFTNGTYQIPLTYVGNAVMPEYGIFYVRALALINDKNLWSDEKTVSVE